MTPPPLCKFWQIAGGCRIKTSCSRPPRGLGSQAGGTSLGFITLFSVSGGPTRFSKQQAQAKWAKHHNSIVVLWIRLNFWWMIPMGVKNHHTKYEPKTQRRWPGTHVASGRPPFHKLQFRAKNSICCPELPKNVFKTAKGREMVATL